MLPHYTTIQDGDIEKQPLVSDYQYGHSCECVRQQQEQKRRSTPSKSTVAIFVLLLLLFVGYGHNLCQQKHNHSNVISNVIQPGKDQQFAESSLALSNGLRYCPRNYPLDVDWNGKSVYEFGEEITTLSVEHKRRHKGRLSTMPGDVVVVVNKELEKSKVTFDIKLSSDRSQDAIRIDESWSKHGLALTVVTHDHEFIDDCVKIDVLIEVPTSTALNALVLDFINSDITFKDKLQLKDVLGVNNVSGDIVFKELTTSSKVALNVVSGGISGNFDVDQVDFSAASVSGNVDIDFNRIKNDSTINIATTSGNVNLKLPSDFISKFAISVVSGNVDVNAKEVQKLHYRRSGGIIGHKVNGHYGDDESPGSEIKLGVVSGNVKLSYQ